MLDQTVDVIYPFLRKLFTESMIDTPTNQVLEAFSMKLKELQKIVTNAAATVKGTEAF